MIKIFFPFTLFTLFSLAAMHPGYGQKVFDDRLEQERAEITMDFFKYRPVDLEKDLPTITKESLRSKPGMAFLSSALVPGLGQAANGKWVRGGIYFAVETIGVALHFVKMDQARKEERRYERFADRNWSVVTYAQWLVAYHEFNELSNPHIDELRQEISGIDPAYDPGRDWENVDIELLRNVERSTRYVYPDGVGNTTFSHTMPAYGSQQYYELISKYYQYGPGWNDFGVDRDGNEIPSLYRLNWDGSGMPPNFIFGSGLPESFNNNYRLAGNMLSLLILNHVVSAFDAYVLVKLNNNRLETSASLLSTRQFSIKYHF